MDHSALALLIPILALATGFVVVLKLPSKLFTPRADPRIAALEVELHRLRQELADAHERLDFAERLLAQAHDSRRLEPGG